MEAKNIERLRGNLKDVFEKIESARISFSRHHIVQLIAVSKYTDSEHVREIFDFGHRAFGESKVQSLQEKEESLLDLPIEWHFIGRLQSNKINSLLALKPSLIHSVESFDLAQKIDKRVENGKKVSILLQINSALEEQKNGVEPECAIKEYLKIKESCPNIDLKGVMCMGAHTEEQSDIIKSFEETRAIFEKLQKDGAQICSMGMSSDYELAIKCGANMVRIGSAIFKD